MVSEFADAICIDCGIVLGGSSKSTNVCGTQDSAYSIIDESAERDGEWWNEVKISDASDRQLVDLIEELDKISKSLGFDTDQAARAAELLVEAWKQNFLHGRSKDATIGAVILLTSREFQCPRPIGIVADSVDIEKHEIRNHFSILVNSLQMKLDPPRPCEYLSYLGYRLDMSDTELALARGLLETEKVNTTSNPAGIAAASLYITADPERNLTLKETADAAGLVKETVWKRKSDLIK